MIKSFLTLTVLIIALNTGAQNFSNAFHFQYHNNSLITPIRNDDMILTGGHFQFNNVTYLVNHPLFSLGAGLGLNYSYNEFNNVHIREFHVPLSIVQKTNLPGLNPVLDYIRFGISKNAMLTSAFSPNDGKDFYKITSGLNKNPVSAEVFLGWNVYKRGFIEVGYVFRQLSNEAIYDYGRHNVSVGFGLILGEAERPVEKPLKKQ